MTTPTSPWWRPDLLVTPAYSITPQTPQPGFFKSTAPAYVVPNVPRTVARYSEVMIRNRRLVDIASKVTKMSMSLSTTLQSQLTITLNDPDFKLLEGGLFVGQPLVTYQRLRLRIAGINTLEQGRGQTQLLCRSDGVQQLKLRRGPLIVEGGARGFVGHECQAVGMNFVTAQDAPGTPTDPSLVSREWQPYVQAAFADFSDVPSSWTTFQELSQQTGWMLFEASNVIYFCPASYLFQNSAIVRVRWAGTKAAVAKPPTPPHRSAYGVVTGADGVQYQTTLVSSGLFDDPGVINALGPPACQWSQDATATTGTVRIPAGNEAYVLPGNVIDLSGLPYFAGLYLITSVDYDLDGQDITVGFSTPIDQSPQGGGDTSLINGLGAAGSNISQIALTGSSSDQLGLPVCGPITIASMCKAIGEQETTNFKYTLPPNSAGGPSGAYQYNQDAWKTWARPGDYAKYPEAYLAPPSAQDYAIQNEVSTNYKTFGGDWGKVAAYHITPSWASKPSLWNQVPAPGNPTVKNYVRSVLQRAGGIACSTEQNATPPNFTANAPDFVTLAIQEAAGPALYIYGASPSVNDPDPDSFDCSSLVQWAAGRCGLSLPRTSGEQWDFCKSRAVPLEKAYRIRGALLFVDDGDVPGGEHVAISLGDGVREVAAHTSDLPAAQQISVVAIDFNEFDRAALIPGMYYPGIDPAPDPPNNNSGYRVGVPN